MLFFHEFSLLTNYRPQYHNGNGDRRYSTIRSNFNENTAKTCMYIRYVGTCLYLDLCATLSQLYSLILQILMDSPIYIYVNIIMIGLSIIIMTGFFIIIMIGLSIIIMIGLFIIIMIGLSIIIMIGLSIIYFEESQEGLSKL